MRDKLWNGEKVETVKPKVESKDWGPDGLKNRRWSVSGKIIAESNSHGVIYQVEYEDGSSAWYERRELKRLESGQNTPEERAGMLQKMRDLSDAYYSKATATGCHAFIEFAGLMNEFITVCSKAHNQGQDFPFANTHSGTALPFKPWNLAYLAEKLNCIYGPALLSDKANRDAFIAELFEGQFKLQRHNAVEQVVEEMLGDQV